MHTVIQGSLIFVSLFLLTSVVIGDAFDQTVNQIKTLETELEQNLTRIEEKQTFIEEQLNAEFANHPLRAPKTEFETDADYASRQLRLDEVVDQRRIELAKEHLSSLRTDRLQIQTEIWGLYRTAFLTNDVIATLGRYDANDEYFPITFVANNQSVNVKLYIDRQNDAPNLKNNWDKVVKTAYISIDPGYRRAFAKIKLEYSPLWEEARVWTFHEVYPLANNYSVVAFSPDGKYIATGGDRVHTIWETSSGRELRQKKHNGQVYAVTFSPDGQYLATGDRYRLKLWEVRNGRQIWEKNKPGSSYGITTYASFYAVDFSPDGKYLATANSRGNFVVKVNGGENFWGRTRYYSSYGITIYAASHAVDFSPDGQYLATGDTFNDAVIWNPSSDTLIQQIEHDDDVWTVAFSPDGKYLATGDDTGNMSICEASSGTTLQQIQHDGGWIGDVAFSPDGKYLAGGHESGLIIIYQVKQETITIDSEIIKEKSFQVSGPVHDLAWHPSGNFISDGRRVYRTLLQPILSDLAAKPLNMQTDVNRDGVVDVDDLVLVASNFGKSFPPDANPNPDVNRDGVVDRKDVLEIITALEAAAGAPSAHPQLTAGTLQHWLDTAQQLNNKDETFQKGIRVLEQLLATLIQTKIIPEKTALLPNYPNPFNPETWIPYQLAEPAVVAVSIYSSDGKLVRVLNLGHQPVGAYHHRSRAAYWDGKNELAESVASGVYFYTLTAGEFTTTRKMLIKK